MSLDTIKLPSIDSLKKEARALGHEAADLAEKKIVRPVRQLASDACDAASEGSECTQKMFREQRHRASEWIADNPFAAIGLALGAGLVLSSLPATVTEPCPSARSHGDFLFTD
jgi:ElaB/YqjD/DUF883 family membrane-anchored ribosome-binding protein